MQTAGRTVLFSATTVAVSLAALLVFPLYFLKSFAYAGIAVVVLAAIGAVVVLPAILAALGPPGRPGHAVPAPPAGRARPGLLAPAGHDGDAPAGRCIGGAVVVLLLVLGVAVPAHQLRPARRPGAARGGDQPPGGRRHPPRLHRQRGRRPRHRRPRPRTAPAAVDRAPTPPRISTAAPAWAGSTPPPGTYIGGHLVAPAQRRRRPASPHRTARPVPGSRPSRRSSPSRPQGESLVKAIRAHAGALSHPGRRASRPSWSIPRRRCSAKLPLAGGIIALVTFTVLFLMTGSVLVPVKAVVLNLLSLTATFGAMVWIFQEGHLAHLLHFTPTGTIDTTTPILMFCIAFGLSMDYEVFLLSRIKEEHDRTGDNVASVAVGLERTGRIVTAAALLLAVVFTAFATSQVTFIKLFGIGLTMAVLVDATLVRAVLVPAFMRLAGDANWWAPGAAAPPLPADRPLGGGKRPRPRRPPPAAGARGGGVDRRGRRCRRRQRPRPAGPRARRGEGERLRAEILAAAERLLIDTGDESAVSIRAVAEAVGVTPPSIYLHFADRNELLFAVVEEQFGHLDEVMEQAAVGVDDPLGRVIAGGAGPTSSSGWPIPSTTGC